MAVTFHEQFAGLFEAHYRRLFRYLNRLTGDGELAADLVQEAFIRLYDRGSAPDAPGSWLISVAMNLLRNESTTTRRRSRLLTAMRGEWAHSESSPLPDEQALRQETAKRVRKVIEGMPERERHMLLLSAEGYSYREIAETLDLHEPSVGSLLARARQAFRECYEGRGDASH
jgi:RNA polymerase sigma-70 factor (ECF subfamily)